MKNILVFIVLLLAIKSGIAQNNIEPPFYKADMRWVDSVLKTLSLDEKIAQLIMIPSYTEFDLKHEVAVLEQIEKYKVGSICFFEGNAHRMAGNINLYQSRSKIPLLIAMDAEWGIGMRLSDVAKFPYAMTIGAMKSSELVYRMGAEMAIQLRKTGIHINFAPVVDVNTNPRNPIINYRSFGENSSKVAAFATAFMKGHQDNGVLACAKHFPGHGNTELDSHLDLPIVNKSKAQMEKEELFPYRKLIPQGLSSIMVGHLFVPSLDATPNLPASLSKPIIEGLLKKDMGFRGLVITDALEMKGVSNADSAGVVELRALMAGNDIITLVSSIPKTIEVVKNAIKSGKISQAEIDAKCRKVLMAKQWAGLDKRYPIRVKDITNSVKSSQADFLQTKIFEESVTLLNNKLLPLNPNQKIALLALNADSLTVFEEHLAAKFTAKSFVLRSQLSGKEISRLISELKNFDVVIAGVHGLSQKASLNFGLSAQLVSQLNSISVLKEKLLVAYFGNPYSLSAFKNIADVGTLLITYQENREAHNACANVILGENGAYGHLPVSVEGKFKEGDGIEIAPVRKIVAKNLYPKYEFRGVWVATVANIDWPSATGLTVEKQKKEIVDLLDMHRKNGMNAIIMQVRPAADAFYKSNIEPWSKWLMGVQGKAPDPLYDPLEFFIDECHKRGMEFHAWFNPYRVFNDLKTQAAPNHVSVTNPELMVKYGNLMLFEPGAPKTREFVTKVILDVTRRYDIDAIHFDDYFYPYKIKGVEFPDSASFVKYNRGFAPSQKDDWRRDNVDLIIKMLHDSIKAAKPYVKFGISPFGIWRNYSQDASGSLTKATTNYDDLYADIVKWTKLGWIDYVVPQLYFSMGYKIADFKILADWWSDNSFGKSMYIGQAPYRIDPNAKDSAFRSSAEIMKQIRYIRQNPTIQGSAYFSSKSFNSNPFGLNDSLQATVYKYQALIPPMKWIDSIPPVKPNNIKFEKTNKGVKLSWKASGYIYETDRPAYFVVYRFDGDKVGDYGDPSAIQCITKETEFTVEQKKSWFGRKTTFVVTALDRLYNESEPGLPITLKLK
jgi:beta-glucosidase-like glycosyl hydrolase/uncharacterized lipoprotein YddW (UPF0748 family)